MPDAPTPTPTAALCLSTPTDLGITVQRQGLEISRELAYEEWSRFGKELSILNTASPWMLGDWLAYGAIKYAKSHWGGRVPDGLYSRIAAETGYSTATLANLKYVCSTLPASRRREGLTVGHAQEIIGRIKDPKEQDKWIKRVLTDNLPVKTLRESLRKACAKVDAEPNDKGTPSILETARQFSRDMSLLTEDATPAARQECLRILAPVLEKLRG